MKKKRTCTTLSILLLTLALLLSSCQGAAEPMETGETKGVATKPGVVQTTEAPVATTEKTAEMTKTDWTQKEPPVAPEDFVVSSVQFEKTVKIWTEDMIKTPYAAKIFIQPNCAGKEYSIEDFLDVNCTEIYLTKLIDVDGVHTKRITLLFDNPSNSKEVAVSVMEELEKRNDVYKVEAATISYVLDVPNDYNATNQWAIENISLPDAWDINTGSATVYVGIIDHGIDAKHPDL